MHMRSRGAPCTRLRRKKPEPLEAGRVMLQFGVEHREEDHWKHRISYAAAQTPVAAVDDAMTMFEQIFGSIDLDEDAKLRLKESRLSVLDSVFEDLDRLAQRTGKSDQMKIERHLNGLRELELQIQNGVGCSATPPADTAGQGWGGYPQRTGTMLDLLVTSLACDATRSATFMWGWENSNAKWPHLNLGVDDDRYHGLSHRQGGPEMDAYATIQQWYVQQFKELLDRLDAVPQAEGTMLDHTVVVWASPTSVSWNHTSRNLPILIGGRGGGYFTTDRYHKYGDLPGDNNSHLYHGGRTMNDLHLSLIHAMGFGEVETFGDPAFCTEPLL